MTRELLLEIGTEEIPSRFLPSALKQLSTVGGEAFQDARLEYQKITVFATPRRLVLYVEGLAKKQADIREKIKGPARCIAFTETGEATKAGKGFARSQGVSIQELEIDTLNGTEYVFAVKETRGELTLNLLPQILPRVISKLSFPKPMYWESREIRFARPIRWLLALYGEEMIPFQFAGLTAGRETRGHRFLAPGPFTVKDPAHYFQLMKESNVILDQEKRQALIRQQVDDAANKCGGRPLIDEDLLEEVNYLVEKPQAVIGSFSTDYLSLPQEVLITTMKVNQRYFPVLARGQEELLPYFIVISNTSAENAINVQRGNEKVLRARLSDARFFFEEDQRQPLESYRERLKGIIFQEELGSIYDKQQRIKSLAVHLAHQLSLESNEIKKVERVADLCKADLATNMVSEFPELQGIMGREYALLSAEDKEVAMGIYEHCLPRFADDNLPKTVPGMLVSIADKLDTIAGCFKIGIEPTGSQDPYALRRQALGITAILVEGRINLELEPLVRKALNQFNKEQNVKDKLVEKITAFFPQRIRFLLGKKGFLHELIDAVLGADGLINPALMHRIISILQKWLNRQEFKNVLSAYTRVANIANKATADREPRSALLQEDSEKGLYERYLQASSRLQDLWANKDYDAYIKELSSLREPIDLFFDNVMVMVEDKELRQNRLALLKSLQQLYLRIADFSKIKD
ncbi:MAG: glycine--tRNA ligase subunit beta [Dethiobacteria bacterium]|jgi:glycyl-tRNA synthetase beta chain